MRATFLAHSGFLVEFPSVTLLFDWWKGELPPLPQKPLLIFASHGHEDHFTPAIFALDDGTRPIHFLLAHNIPLTEEQQAQENIRTMFPGEQVDILPGIAVETLASTDEGVAFLVTANGCTVFHAGDLNWWHWEGEPDPWNPDMARMFKAYAEPLRDRTIDLAMLPLDSRLGEAGFWGAKHFLEIADIRRFLPMHQWGDFGFSEKFLQAFPQFADRTLPVTERGQQFEF